MKNFTPIPHILMERLLLAKLSNEELKIMLVIARWTLGWQNRLSHTIALSEFTKMTGIHKANVKECLKTLVNRRIIDKSDSEDHNKAICRYGINRKCNQWVGVVQQTTQNGVDGGSPADYPMVVHQTTPPVVQQTTPHIAEGGVQQTTNIDILLKDNTIKENIKEKENIGPPSPTLVVPVQAPKVKHEIIHEEGSAMNLVSHPSAAQDIVQSKYKPQITLKDIGFSSDDSESNS